MGLDCSHDAWHGAYSAFHRWRIKLAEVAGYAIADLDYDGVKRETILVDWGHLQDKLYGDWDKTPDDPLLILIAHSDCEGQINPPQLVALADRLDELLPELAKAGDGGGHIGNYAEKTKQFIAGLRWAAEENEPLLFR